MRVRNFPACARAWVEEIETMSRNVGKEVMAICRQPKNAKVTKEMKNL